MIRSPGKSRVATELIFRAAAWPATTSSAVMHAVAAALASAAADGVLRLPTTNKPAVTNARKVSQIQLGLMRKLPATPATTAVAANGPGGLPKPNPR